MNLKSQTAINIGFVLAMTGGIVLHVWTRAELSATRAAYAKLLADMQSARTLVRAIDGDTIELDGGERVRILGIDTPELSEKTPAGGWRRIENPAPAAIASRDWLRSQEGRVVRLSFDKKKKDRYGRTLAHVYLLPNGPDVATELLRRGWAKVVAIPPNTARYADWKDTAERSHRVQTDVQNNPKTTPGATKATRQQNQ